jgi:hypothetical protein
MVFKTTTNNKSIMQADASNISSELFNEKLDRILTSEQTLLTPFL